MDRQEMLVQMKERNVWIPGLPYLNDAGQVRIYLFWGSQGSPNGVEISWNAGNPFIWKGGEQGASIDYRRGK